MRRGIYITPVLIAWASALVGCGVNPPGLGRKVLSFDVNDPREVIRCGLTEELLLQAERWHPDWHPGRWVVKVLLKHTPDRPGDLLWQHDNFEDWFSPTAATVDAWRVKDRHFPDLRRLDIRGFEHKLSIRLVDVVVREENDKVTFAGGKIEIYFKSDGRLAPVAWTHPEECLRSPRLLAGGATVRCRRLPLECWQATFRFGGREVRLDTARREVMFWGFRRAPGVVAVHDGQGSGTDAVTVIDLSQDPPARVDLRHDGAGAGPGGAYEVHWVHWPAGGCLPVTERQRAASGRPSRHRRITVSLRHPFGRLDIGPWWTQRPELPQRTGSTRPAR